MFAKSDQRRSQHERRFVTETESPRTGLSKTVIELRANSYNLTRNRKAAPALKKAAFQ